MILMNVDGVYGGGKFKTVSFPCIIVAIRERIEKVFRTAGRMNCGASVGWMLPLDAAIAVPVEPI
jgi:hypothetical protein